MTDRFQQEFFPRAEKRTVTLDLLSDEWDRLLAFFAENEWEQDDGLRYTLAAGLACLQTEADSVEVGLAPAGLAAEIKRLQRERMEVESRYAVMKYRAFTFMQAAKVLEMKLNACRVEAEALRTHLGRLLKPPADR